MNKKIKMVVTDLDGTLLKNDGTVDCKTVDLLVDIQTMGHSVVFATSRHISECKKYAKRILQENRGYIVASEGQYICDYRGNVIHTFSFMNTDHLCEIVKEFNANKLVAVTDGVDYVFSRKRKIADSIFNSVLNLRRGKQRRVILNTVKLRTANLKIEKMIVHSSDQIKLESTMISKYNITCLRNGIYEIRNASVDKLYGREYLSNYLNIDNNNIFVFGNDSNDLKMLSSYVNSYAMGNASMEVLAVAKEVIDSNQNCGVYWVLRKEFE